MGTLRSNVTFVRLFAGRVVTNAGDSLYYIAAMWLVYDLTGSAFYTGLAGFLVQGPSALQFLVGPLVDRWSLRRVLYATQAIQGVCVLAVPLAAWTGHLSVWLILLLMPVLTFVSQFVYPAQNAALPRIVDDDQLTRANSLFSSAYHATDTVFNAASGVLVAAVGAVTLYIVDAVTFGAALLLFLGVRMPDAEGVENAENEAAEESDETAEQEEEERYFDRLRAGFEYVRGSVVFTMMLGTALVNFAAGAMFGVLPAYAASLGGPETYGLLMAAFGAGNFVGTIGASLVEDRPFGRFAVVGFAVSGTLLFGAFTVGWLPATVALFFAAFVPVGTFNVMTSSLLQSAVADDLLGRVTSIASSASMVMTPVGSLVGGTVAGVLGSATVMYGLAGSLAVLAVHFGVRPRVRTLPPVAEADEATLGLGSSLGTAEGGDETASATADD